MTEAAASPFTSATPVFNDVDDDLPLYVGSGGTVREAPTSSAAVADADVRRLLLCAWAAASQHGGGGGGLRVPECVALLDAILSRHGDGVMDARISTRLVVSCAVDDDADYLRTQPERDVRSSPSHRALIFVGDRGTEKSVRLRSSVRHHLGEQSPSSRDDQAMRLRALVAASCDALEPMLLLSGRADLCAARLVQLRFARPGAEAPLVHAQLRHFGIQSGRLIGRDVAVHDSSRRSAWIHALRTLDIDRGQGTDDLIEEITRLLDALVHLSHVETHESNDHPFAELADDDELGGDGNSDGDGGGSGDDHAHGSSDSNGVMDGHHHPSSSCASCSTSTSRAVVACAGLLGVTPAKMTSALTQRIVLADEGGEEDDSGVAMPLRAAEAAANRDALSRELHRLLFGWLQGYADAVLDASSTAGSTSTSAAAAAATATISFVEVPGFERHARARHEDGASSLRDGLDTLLANYTWEKQRAFLLRTAAASNEAHPSLADAARAASAELIALFEAVPDGLLAAIERHGRVSNRTLSEGDLCASLAAAHSQVPRPRWQLEHGAFVVRHFVCGAGDAEDGVVAYPLGSLLTADGFACSKSLPLELTRLLASSSFGFIHTLVSRAHAVNNPYGTRKVAARASRSGQLRRDMTELFASALRGAECSVVACVAPLDSDAAGANEPDVDGDAMLGARARERRLLEQLLSIAPLVAVVDAAVDPALPATVSERAGDEGTPAVLPLLSEVRAASEVATQPMAHAPSTADSAGAPSAAEGAAALLPGAPGAAEPMVTDLRSLPPQLSPAASHPLLGLPTQRLRKAASSRRVISAKVEGHQVLTSLMELRTWSQRGAIWAPVTCTLLSDEELLLQHTGHPPYSASIASSMITSVTVTVGHDAPKDEVATAVRATRRRSFSALFRASESEPGEIGRASGGRSSGGADEAMSTSRGPLLTLSLGKQQIVLCHSDVRVLQRWDRAISQCAGIDRMLEKVPTKESPRNQKLSKGVAADGGPLAWKTGSVRVLVEDDGDEHQPPVMPPCHATLTPECVLHIDRADAGGGAPPSGSSTRVAEMPLASVLSLRVLPPYRPVLEIRASGSGGGADARGVDDMTGTAAVTTTCLCFDSAEEVLSWMGMLITLLPACKRGGAEHSETPWAAVGRVRCATGLPPKARMSLHAAASGGDGDGGGGGGGGGGGATGAEQRQLRAPSRSLTSGMTRGGSMKRLGAGSRGELARGDGNETLSVLIAGPVRIFLEKNGVQKWVDCHGRLGADGVLTVRGVSGWEVRLNVLVRAAISIIKIGGRGHRNGSNDRGGDAAALEGGGGGSSASARSVVTDGTTGDWAYLRLELPNNHGFSLQVVGGEGMCSLWVRELERISGLKLTAHELSGWVELQVRAATAESAARRVQFAGDGAPIAAAAGDAAEDTWRTAYVVLLANHRLMWFSSLHAPKPLGVLELQSIASVTPMQPAAAARGAAGGAAGGTACGAVELRTMASTRVLMRGPCVGASLDEWQSMLRIGVELCRRNAEAKRLIDVHIRASHASSGAASSDDLDEDSYHHKSRRSSRFSLQRDSSASSLRRSLRLSTGGGLGSGWKAARNLRWSKVSNLLEGPQDANEGVDGGGDGLGAGGGAPTGAPPSKGKGAPPASAPLRLPTLHSERPASASTVLNDLGSKLSISQSAAPIAEILCVDPPIVLVFGWPTARTGPGMRYRCHLEVRGVSGGGGGAEATHMLVGRPATTGASSRLHGDPPELRIDLRDLLDLYSRCTPQKRRQHAVVAKELRLLLPLTTVAMRGERAGDDLSAWLGQLQQRCRSKTTRLATLPSPAAVVLHEGWLSKCANNGEAEQPIYCRLLGVHGDGSGRSSSSGSGGGGDSQRSNSSGGSGGGSGGGSRASLECFSVAVDGASWVTLPPLEVRRAVEVADEGHRSAALRAPSLPWLSGMVSCCTPCVVAPNDAAAGATRMELVIPPGRDSRDRRIEMFDANEEKNLNAWMDALSALGVPVSRLGGAARAPSPPLSSDDRRYSKGLADDSRQLLDTASSDGAVEPSDWDSIKI